MIKGSIFLMILFLFPFRHPNSKKIDKFKQKMGQKLKKLFGTRKSTP